MGPFHRGIWLVVVLALAPTSGKGAPPAGGGKPDASARPAAVDRYGDPLPAGARARMGSIRLRHGGQVFLLRYAPDGKSLVSAAGDGTVSLWDAASKKERRQFKGRPLGAQSLGFSPDGKTLMLVGEDLSIQSWDTASGELVRKVPGPKYGLLNVAFSPDAKLLAVVGQDQTVKLWDTARGQETAVLQGPPANANPNPQFIPAVVTFSPDGRLLAAGGHDGWQSAVRCWDVVGGNQVLQFGLPRNGGIQTLVFSPDGKTVVVEDGGQVTYLIDATTGKEIRQQNGRSHLGPYSDAFSPDGKLLASVNGDEVHLEEPATGKAVRQFHAGQQGVSALAFSPDGKVLATGGVNNLIRLWDVATGKSQPIPGGHQGAVTAVAVSADGRWVASASPDQTVRVWELATGKERHRFRRREAPNADDEPPTAVPVFAADGKTLAAAWNNGLIRSWDLATGKQLGQFEDAEPPGAVPGVQAASPDTSLMALAFSPDASVVALGQPDGSLRLREVATGRLVRQLQVFKAPDPNGAWAGTPGVTLVVYSPDGKTLAVGGADFSPPALWNGTGSLPAVRLLEVATGKERRRLRFPGNPFADPDYYRLIGTNFFLNAGVVLSGEWSAGAAGLSHSAFAPNSRTLAVSTGSAVHLWDLARGKTVRAFAGTSPLSSGIAFSPDGTLLAGGTIDGSVYLWETASGTELVRQEGHRGPVQSVTFSRDGRALITGGMDTTLLVWDVAALREAGRHHPPVLSAERLEALWKDLAAEDSAQADQAGWALALSPRQSLPFLQARLRPAAPVDSRRVLRLIRELESDQYPVRQRASAELAKLGELAETALRAALRETSSPEVRKRAEALLAEIEKPVTAPEALRASRVVEVLERIGTAEARQTLQRLAAGAPEARLTRDAAKALERLQAQATALDSP